MVNMLDAGMSVLEVMRVVAHGLERLIDKGGVIGRWVFCWDRKCVVCLDTLT